MFITIKQYKHESQKERKCQIQQRGLPGETTRRAPKEQENFEEGQVKRKNQDGGNEARVAQAHTPKSPEIRSETNYIALRIAAQEGQEPP